MRALYAVVALSLLAVCRPGGLMGQDLDFETARGRLVETLTDEGISDQRVLEAIGSVERHRFVPESYRRHSYENRPLPIGENQTISQPYIVARMTELLELEPTDRVLEIGTGSGYQAAVLAELAADVYTIEIIQVLGENARVLLVDEIGYQNVYVRIGDGYRGWPEQAPFDAVIVTAAPDHIPQPLMDQLRVGARLVIPVGDAYQYLTVVERTESGFDVRRDVPVRFVPMTGEAREGPPGVEQGGP